jgi:hypothetical protein
MNKRNVNGRNAKCEYQVFIQTELKLREIRASKGTTRITAKLLKLWPYKTTSSQFESNVVSIHHWEHSGTAYLIMGR